MRDCFKITLAQLNATVGDFNANIAKIKKAHKQAKAQGADMLALPEMFLTGYQIQDMAQKIAFVDNAQNQLRILAQDLSNGPAIGVGAPFRKGNKVYNAYAILQHGDIITQICKHHLPNYRVFDEKRTYSTGKINGPYEINGVRIGSPICEDAWFPDICETLAETGAEIFLCPNGSPYYRGKHDTRLLPVISRVIETKLPFVYLNLVGGQDDQVFDGGSFVLNSDASLVTQFPVFEEYIETITFTHNGTHWHAKQTTREILPSQWEQDYHAMVLGLRDYVNKAGFERVILGLSGGIDSALVASIAADALKAENVHCVMLPSKYTSTQSIADAQRLANNLGCQLDIVPISPSHTAITQTLAPLFSNYNDDLTEENIQSRLRGLLLMALSNKFGSLLLSTGNKSEIAIGYATIYGDMAGGYNPIKDLYKTRVFETCRWRNANHRPWMHIKNHEIIPETIIEKPPSAELRDNQKDSDNLPEYDVLDGILDMLIDQDASVRECIKAGFDENTVKHIEHLIYASEYKRFQSAPGVRLTPRAFWLDRRYPIANRWRDNT